MSYSIVFSPRARENLEALRKHEQQLIMDALEEQLVRQPEVPTKKRKHLRENPLAPWELRLGDLRVFYDVHSDNEQVLIVAVGRKQHNQLLIGGEVIEL
jgi:mRNA-degrading endonuclease RelE of RelBE toxin-antitoxin system